MTPALLLLLALHAQDPIQVGARLTEEEIHAGETTTLRVDVRTEGERARIEAFRTLPPGIEVQGTRDFDQRQFSLPGGTRRFITREFVLRARMPGRYRIPSVNVEVDGEIYTTRPLLLTVTSAPARERGELRTGDEGVVLRAWLDADTVFVGEQVTLEVEAMFSQDARMRLRRAPEYEAPSPSGFWVHELSGPSRPVTRTVGGELFEVQRFRRAFFPLSPGRFTIPPARLEYEMRRGLLYAPETRELTSDPLPLVVLPVPADRPPAFNGAVGDFDVRARIEPATVPVGEATVLTVTVSGVGNVKALPAPVLPAMPDVEVFPPGEEAETVAQGTTIQGHKTFSWVLIPRKAGDLEIPPVRYAFFDPDVGGFETATVGPVPLRATPAAADDAAPPAATLRFLKTAPEPDPLGWVRSPWFAALMAVPALLLALGLVLRRRRGRRGEASPVALRRERKQTVRALEERVDDPADRELFADAERFARSWLARRLGLAGAAVGDPDALNRAGVADGDAATLRALLDRLAAGRYAPTPPGETERRTVIRALGRALEGVDRSAPAEGLGGSDRAGRGSAAGTTALVVVLAAGTLAGGPGALAGTETAAVQEESATELFSRGLDRYEDGEFAAAAELFNRYVRRAPEDAAGWYNLGTAYQRAGEPGRGVWAWLRALRLDPRDGDTRHNLRVAAVPPELVQRVTPPLPLRRSELLALAGLAWVIGGIGGLVWLYRRRRGTGIASLTALAVAVVLAAVWWGSTRGAETLIVLDSATLRAGPALRAEPVATVEAGAGLVPVDRYGAWVRARTLRGEEGWIESTRTGEL
ncbi:MAG: BatD family protein [Candidatus Longimicrobiales bacterium M2_2A_002]